MPRNTSDTTLLVAKWTSAFAFFLAASLGPALRPVTAQDPEKEGAGLVIDSGQADVGLPVYPGSKPRKENTHESEAARLGFWGVAPASN